MLRHGFIPRGTAAARLIKIATKHHRFKKERGAGEELMITTRSAVSTHSPNSFALEAKTTI
jgi:hypothetical protein